MTSRMASSLVIRQVFGSLRLWVLLMFLAYVAWFVLDDNLGIELFYSLSPVLVALLCSLTLLSFFLRFIRWHTLLRLSGYSMPMLWHFTCYISGFAFTATPGKVGETIRSFYLARRGVPVGQSLGLFFCDRFCDLFALVIWGLVFLVAESLVGMGVALLLLAILLVPFFLVKTSLLEDVFGWCIGRYSNQLIVRVMAFVIRIKKALEFYFDPWRFLVCIVVSLCSWSLIGLELQVVLHYYGVDMSFFNAMGVTAAGLIAGALSMIPGGLGVNELVQDHMLDLLGVANETGKIAILITRVCTLWFAISLGGLALCFMGQKLRITPR